MAELFETVEINGMRLRNRSVRSATWTGLAEPDGRYSKKLMRLSAELAKGEIGLIITGFAYVLPNGKALAGQAGIHDDTMIPRLKEATKKVHKAGGKICMQIVHAGAQTLLRESKENPIWGPSAVLNKIFQKTPKAMSQREIKDTVHAFGKAAARVKKAGFDGVEIHGAHGYLVSQFLSPATNKRTDKYGGSLTNRARFLFQIYRAVRKAVGKNFPVLIKLNCKDFVRGGLKDTDAISLAKQLEKMGIDAIEVSGGVPAAGDLGPARLKIRKASDEAYFLSIAKRIKKQVSVPVILVGGIRSFESVNDILKTDQADLISMSRPFIREPHLIKRWKKGNHKKATCISCNKCFPTGMSRDGLHCTVERRLLERKKK